jgi:hypothetical protein
MMRGRLFAGVLVPLLLLGCSHSKSVNPLYSVNPDVISDDEILSVASNVSTAYDIIKKLRGNWFSYRGKTSLIGTSNADPTVYVDDQAYGPISSLRTIPASQVTQMRIYRSWEATTKYGTGNMGGVIAVATKQ